MYTQDFAAALAKCVALYIPEAEFEDCYVYVADQGTAVRLFARRYNREYDQPLQDFTEAGVALAVEDLRRWFRLREVN